MATAATGRFTVPSVSQSVVYYPPGTAVLVQRVFSRPRRRRRRIRRRNRRLSLPSQHLSRSRRLLSGSPAFWRHPPTQSVRLPFSRNPTLLRRVKSFSPECTCRWCERDTSRNLIAVGRPVLSVHAEKTSSAVASSQHTTGKTTVIMIDKTNK